MSNLTEKSLWEPGIYQLETSDPVVGGPDGIDNLQAKQLGNRTLYLKGEIEAHAKAQDPHMQYAPKDSPTLTGTPNAPTAAFGTNTTQIASAAFVLANAMPQRAAIANGSDLNSISTPGYYVQVNSANASLVLNYPRAIAGALRVIAPQPGAASSLIFQEYHEHGGNGVWYRAAYAGSWYPWRRAAFTDSPDFSGTPTAPTASVGTNTTQLATTAFVQQGIAAIRSLTANQVRNVSPSSTAKAALSVHFVSKAGIETGTPAGDDYGDLLTLNTYADMTGGYQNGLLFTKMGSSKQGIFHYRSHQANDTRWPNTPKQLAYTDSPDLVGTPTAPTAAADTATTQLATTAFVMNQAGTAMPKMDGTADVGTSKRYARQDHVHPPDNTRAPLASPAFTGRPTVPTPVAGSNNELIANTAFVAAAISALVNSSPAALDTLQELAAALGNDPNFATTITKALALKAPLESPGLTGSPKAPTPEMFDATARLSTTAYVMRAIGGFSGYVTSNNGDIALSIGNVNQVVFIGALGRNVYLPNPKTLRIGSTITIANQSGQTRYVYAGDGATIFNGANGSGDSYVPLGYSDTVTFAVRDAVSWVICGGTISNQFAFKNASYIKSNGWCRYPNGLIEQWGSIGAPASNGASPGTADGAFPIAFPSACLGFLAGAAGYTLAPGANAFVSGAAISTAAFRVQNNYTPSNIGVCWRAWGN